MSIENPQLEDGHLKIVNSIAETLARTQLSGYEWRVLWFLWRKTYGWSKKTDTISLSQWMDGTGLDRRHVARTIKHLIEKRIVTTSSANLGTSKLSTYTFNKHFGEWLPSANLGTTSAKIGTGGSAILGPLPSANLGTHNNNLYNSNTDKDLKDCAEEEKSGAPLFDNPPEVMEEPEAKPDKAIQVTTSVPYLLASWFYALRHVPVRPIPADMHYFKLLLQFYPESVIKQGIEWRLSHDPQGFWTAKITPVAVYRQFGNWMAESSVKAISLKQWVAKNPDMDFDRFTDPLARADAFMRAFNEAKKNRLVYFEDSDYVLYKKAIRIKTAESKAEIKGGRQ